MTLNNVLGAIAELVLLAVILGAALNESGPDDENLLEMFDDDEGMMYQ